MMKDEPISSTEKQRRIDLIADFVDLCESKGISLLSSEFKQISAAALKDGFISYGGKSKLISLLDIDVENISDKEVTIIIKRARTALKRLLELKKKYIAGPFYSSRHDRRALDKVNKKKSRRASNRSTVASKIVKEIKDNKSGLIVLPPAM